MNKDAYAVISNGLTKRFGRKRALDNVSLHIPTGAVYALLGTNGAGKTTFVRCLLNLIEPTSGTASVLGHHVVREGVAARRRIGHVAALQPLWEWMRVDELAKFIAGCYPSWNQHAVDELLLRVHIDPRARLQGLSRGQRALASLAVAIGHDPELLILDEALTGLDPLMRREILRTVIETMHAAGRTVLIVGQDIADMERICDHVALLVEGRLVTEAPLDDLKEQVKRINITHAPDAEIALPEEACTITRDRRATSFVLPNAPAYLAAPPLGFDMHIEVEDLNLEAIFMALASPDMAAPPTERLVLAEVH
jgi:ABC-2 type transport system ATP-binding protein